MKELTKDILKMETKYKYYVTEDGQIFSEQLNGFMKQEICKNGYHRVQIRNKHYLVHRLVAMAFIPNTGNKPVVNHKNQNLNDNSVSNLEWCTIRENVTYEPTKRLRDANIKRGQECNFHKLTEKEVIQIINLINKKVPSNEISEMFFVVPKTIRNIKNKKTWKHLSYLLK